jgi:hypothetical protein
MSLPFDEYQATAAAGGTAVISFTSSQRIGTAVDPGYTGEMFLGVAMFQGTIAPSFALMADNGPAAPVDDRVHAISSPAGGSDFAETLPLVTDPYFTDTNVHTLNVYLIKVGFIASPDPTTTWHLQITNHDPANAEKFTVVVAGSKTESEQPWLDVAFQNPTSSSAPGTLTYEVLIGDTVSDSVTISNNGTVPFGVTGVTPALPSSMTLSPAVTPATPLTVLPGASQSLTVTFSAPPAPPSPDGITHATVTLVTSPSDQAAGTSTGHNQQLTIAATTQQLEVIMLLDDSGSMSWAPDGTPLGAGSMSARWWELRDASSNFLDALGHFGNKHGIYGIARFPAGDPADTSTFNIVLPSAIPKQSDMASAKAAIAAVTPTDNTPMGDGLDWVLNPVTSYFNTDALSVAADRRWLILMSDGANNSGTHDPLAAIAPGNGLKEKHIKMFALAYGLPGHSNVDHNLLTVLESSSYTDSDGGGQIGVVDRPDTTPMDFTAVLKSAIKAGLRELASSNDPSAVFLVGQAEARHDVLLTPYDDKPAFAINWNTPDASRLRLELLSPSCELVTPETAGEGTLSAVTFSGGTRFQSYYFDPNFLANPGGSSRYGTWTMVVTPESVFQAREADAGAALAAAEVYENYTYDVITESTLRMRLTLDRAAYYAGDPVVVSARLTAAGVPVTGASVVLSTTAPAQSLANWLAGITVPADAMTQAAHQLQGRDATPILVKTLGAQIAGLRFDPGMRQGDLVMTDSSGFGTYQATYTDTSVPEQRTLYVTAIGVTPDGVAFRREGKVGLFVRVRPDPAASILTLNFGSAGTANATVFPRDRFGNVLFIEPLSSGSLQLVASGAEFTGPMVNNLDGSYSRPLRITGASPAVGVQFDGQDVIPARPLPPLADLHYVDEVIRFNDGAIASANQHGDPQAVLGSIDGKPADTFVSLGAAGQLTVGFRRQVILATDGGDDITVFIQPDDDLRSYRLEAYSTEHRHDDDDDGYEDHEHGDRRHWVPLGDSIGVTQSFSLRAAGLESAPALRITDTSGRVRGADFNPLTTPGVSVRGVGVLRTGRDRPFRLEDVPDWLARLWRELT